MSLSTLVFQKLFLFELTNPFLCVIIISLNRKGVIFLNERLKEIRNYTGLSQAKFGSVLGVSRDSINNYELGRVVPSELFINHLCDTYNINEEWLRNGTGEMLTQTPKNILDELVAAHGLTEKETAIVSAFLDLSPAGRSAIIEYVEKAARGLSSDPASSAPTIKDNKFQIKTAESYDNNRIAWSAARSQNYSPPEITELSKEQLERLHNAPSVETDDDL